jgi:membrane-bound ClpP family serine protease
MLLKSSKVNEFRLWGLLLTMFGLLIMIIGMAGIVFDWGTVGKVIAAIFLVLGLISVMASMAIYFWAGMLSTSAVVIECPECAKPTKMIGTTDRCMFCKTILTLDPKIANTPESSTK